MQYIHFDRSALDPLAPVDRYTEASAAIEQARTAVSDAAAYRDAVVAAMVAARPGRGGQSEVARILGIHRNAVTTHLKHHKERTMPQVVPQSEDITTTPALTYLHAHGTLHVTAVGKAGLLAQISVEMSRDHPKSEMLDQLTDEIAPWLPALDALCNEDQARTAAAMVDRALRWHGQAEGVADERDRWAQLEDIVERHQTPADVTAAGRDPLAHHIADAIVDRLIREADQAHQRAVDAAPGQVPELLLWTTPKPSGESLAEWLQSRLT